MLCSFTNFDGEAGVGFHMHVEAEGWSSGCKGKGRHARSQMGAELKDCRHPSENRPEHKKVLEAK